MLNNSFHEPICVVIMLISPHAITGSGTPQTTPSGTYQIHLRCSLYLAQLAMIALTCLERMVNSVIEQLAVATFDRGTVGWR